MTTVLTEEDVAPALLPSLDEAGRALLFTDARTANTFSNEPVTDQELNDIWELAKWAPSAANTQPLRVLYVQSPEARLRLGEHMNDNNKAKTLTAPAVAVLAYDTDFHDFIPQVFPIRPEMRDYFAGDANKAGRVEHSKTNSWLQTGYFILSVRAHGLAAGPMAGFQAEALDADFFPDGRWKSLLVVNIGHPGANEPQYPRLPRLGHSDVVSFV